MKTTEEHWRAIIRMSVRESVGHGMAYSVKEAAEITGLYVGTIYQIADGRMKFPERHLMALMDLPVFEERLMAHRGHACTYIGNEAGDEWEAISELMSATGEASGIVADRKITDPERKRLADRFHRVIAKAQAFLYRFKRQRAGVA